MQLFNQETNDIIANTIGDAVATFLKHYWHYIAIFFAVLGLYFAFIIKILKLLK